MTYQKEQTCFEFYSMYKTHYDSAKRIWSGNKFPPILNTNQSVGQAILWTLKKDPTKIGQVREFRALVILFAENV